MLRIKQLPELNPKHVCYVCKSRHRWRIDAALHQPNEIDRVVRFFGELFLSQSRLTAKVRDVLAEKTVKVRHSKSVEDLH